MQSFFVFELYKNFLEGDIMLNITQKWNGKMCVLFNQNLSVLKNVRSKMYFKI